MKLLDIDGNVVEEVVSSEDRDREVCEELIERGCGDIEVGEGVKDGVGVFETACIQSRILDRGEALAENSSV